MMQPPVLFGGSMDHFGIGNAIRAVAEIYFRSCRRTGRTTTLLESVKDGDRVVFVDVMQADRFRRLCIERKLRVDCIVIDPQKPYHLMHQRMSLGRTIFDHVWVEQFYLNRISECEAEIDRMQKDSSGFGTPHIETRRKAE